MSKLHKGLALFFKSLLLLLFIKYIVYALMSTHVTLI